MMHNLPQEWKAELLTIEIGARGMVAQETKQDVHNMFRLLGRTKDAKQCAGKCIAEARRRALLGSYLVWNFRDREEWDLTETVGRWRGQQECTNLASVDRARQRKEREEADAAGTWSDESGGEQEKNPDEANGTLDWEVKTQGRERVREEAEKAGDLCYYPDGSLREARSGWGWIAQQAGRELRSDYGPVRLYGEDGWLGAQYHSNNAGELCGVISVLRDIEKHVEKGE